VFRKNNTHFCFLAEVSTDLSENFREYSRGNVESTHLFLFNYSLLAAMYGAVTAMKFTVEDQYLIKSS